MVITEEKDSVPIPASSTGGPNFASSEIRLGPFRHLCRTGDETDKEIAVRVRKGPSPYGWPDLGAELGGSAARRDPAPRLGAPELDGQRCDDQLKVLSANLSTAFGATVHGV